MDLFTFVFWRFCNASIWFFTKMFFFKLYDHPKSSLFVLNNFTYRGFKDTQYADPKVLLCFSITVKGWLNLSSISLWCNNVNSLWKPSHSAVFYNPFLTLLSFYINWYVWFMSLLIKYATLIYNLIIFVVHLLSNYLLLLP